MSRCLPTFWVVSGDCWCAGLTSGGAPIECFYLPPFQSVRLGGRTRPGAWRWQQRYITRTVLHTGPRRRTAWRRPMPAHCKLVRGIESPGWSPFLRRTPSSKRRSSTRSALCQRPNQHSWISHQADMFVRYRGGFGFGFFRLRSVLLWL